MRINAFVWWRVRWTGRCSSGRDCVCFGNCFGNWRRAWALEGVGSGFSMVKSLRGQVGMFRRRQRGNRQWQGWGLTRWHRCSSVSGSHLGFGERQGTVKLRGILGMSLEREVELFINALMIWGRLGDRSPRLSTGVFRPRHIGYWRRSGGQGRMIWAR